MLNYSLRNVTGCLRPTPTNYIPVFLGIQPTELRRQGAIFFIFNRGYLDPDNILRSQLHGSQDISKKRLKFRRPFVLAARKLLNSLSEMGIRAAYWTNTK